jgi:hypothetical protein
LQSREPSGCEKTSFGSNSELKKSFQSYLQPF